MYLVAGHHSRDTYFIRTNKILIRLNVLVFEGFQYQKVLILFLFSMKHFYFFMGKITRDMAEITSLWD